MKIIDTVGVVFFTLIILGKPVFSSELMNSADVYESGSWQLSVYGQHVEEEPIVETKGGAGFQVPTSGGGSTTLFSNSTTEIEMESEFDAIIAALTFRPFDGLHYRVKVGQIRDYEVAFASGSDTNSFKSISDGFLWGVAGRWNITQDTLVSTAFSLDFSYTQRIVGLEKFQSGTTVTTANHKIEQDEYQVAATISRRWKWIDPYGGLKVNRLVTRLKDKTLKQNIRGERDGISPFVGIGVALFDREQLFVEASFLDEEAISTGIQIKFK